MRDEDCSGWFSVAFVFILLACVGVAPVDAVDPALEEISWWPIGCVVAALGSMALGDRANRRRQRKRYAPPCAKRTD